MLTKQRALLQESHHLSDNLSASFELVFGCDEDPHQTLEEIYHEFDEVEAFLKEIYEQKKKAKLKDRFITTRTQL